MIYKTYKLICLHLIGARSVTTSQTTCATSLMWGDVLKVNIDQVKMLKCLSFMYMLTTSLYIENNIKSVSVGQKILQLIRLQLFGKNTRRRSFLFRRYWPHDSHPWSESETIVSSALSPTQINTLSPTEVVGEIMLQQLSEAENKRCCRTRGELSNQITGNHMYGCIYTLYVPKHSSKVQWGEIQWHRPTEYPSPGVPLQSRWVICPSWAPVGTWQCNMVEPETSCCLCRYKTPELLL